MLGGFIAFFTANIFADKQSPDVANILHHVINMVSVSLLVSVGICTLLVIAGYPIANMVRAIERRRMMSNARAEAKAQAKARSARFDHLARDPLENYDEAQSVLTDAENHLATLRFGDVDPLGQRDYATWAEVVRRAKAVVAVCGRALRIERIAGILDDIAVCEAALARIAAGEFALIGSGPRTAGVETFNDPAYWTPFIESLKADLAAAKTGPMTWYVPGRPWYVPGPGRRDGPRGLGLTVAKVAAAEAELDGFVRLEAEPVEGGRWSAAFAQRMAIAANRALAA